MFFPAPEFFFSRLVPNIREVAIPTKQAENVYIYQKVMPMDSRYDDQPYQSLVQLISITYQQGQAKAWQQVNTQLLDTYWQIGQYIVEFEQGGQVKAAYGKALLQSLSKDLTRLHGRGFSRSNLNYMRLIYRHYPICEELPHKLSWTHFCELVKINDPLERSFYEKQAVLENWSTTELKRQKKSSLFLRLAASCDKKGVLELARKGQILTNPTDLLREPYTGNKLRRG